MATMLRALGLLGVVGFGVLFLVLLAYPKELERSAVGFIKQRIEADLRERFPGLGRDALTQGAERLSAGLAERQRRLRQAIDDGLPALISEVVAGHCGCVAKVELAQSIEEGMRETLARLKSARGRLAEVIRDRYDAILAALRHELMIFLGTNLAAFGLVLAAAGLRGESSRPILLPAALLVVTVVLSSGLYLFNQDWFYAVLFQNYVGYGYAVGMAVIYALLVDIVMNRARVTRKVAAQLPGALGAILVPPC